MRRWRGKMQGEFWSRENDLLPEGRWAVERIGDEVLVRFGGKREEKRYSLTLRQAAELGMALTKTATDS